METGIASVSVRKSNSIHSNKFRPFRSRKMHATDQAGVPS